MVVVGLKSNGRVTVADDDEHVGKKKKVKPTTTTKRQRRQRRCQRNGHLVHHMRAVASQGEKGREEDIECSSRPHDDRCGGTSTAAVTLAFDISGAGNRSSSVTHAHLLLLLVVQDDGHFSLSNTRKKRLLASKVYSEDQVLTQGRRNSRKGMNAFLLL